MGFSPGGDESSRAEKDADDSFESPASGQTTVASSTSYESINQLEHARPLDLAGTGSSLETEIVVLKTSPAPVPETAPYKDCLVNFTARRVVDDKGLPFVGDQIYNFATYAFRDRKWLDGGRLMPGCRLQIKAREFYSAPPHVQSTRRVDETGDFDSPLYFVEELDIKEGFLRALPEPPEEEESRRQVAMIQRILAAYEDGVVGGVRDGWFFDLKETGHYRRDFWKGYENPNPRIEGSFRAILTARSRKSYCGGYFPPWLAHR